LISRSGKAALERATCWARAVRNASQPTFQEFLFFFDYLIQNGDSFTERNTLQSAVLTIQFGKDTLSAKDDPAVRQKMIQIKEWLEAGFKNMRNAGGGRDHADYAKDNAARWMARFDGGAVTKDQVRLAYIGLLRAMLGNNQWAYTAMNRRGTVAFGTGVVNGQDYDARHLRELVMAWIEPTALHPTQVVSMIVSCRSSYILSLRTTSICCTGVVMLTSSTRRRAYSMDPPGCSAPTSQLQTHRRLSARATAN
jgi:hypothetical protein